MMMDALPSEFVVLQQYYQTVVGVSHGATPPLVDFPPNVTGRLEKVLTPFFGAAPRGCLPADFPETFRDRV
jgi:hypothetical protein